MLPTTHIMETEIIYIYGHEKDNLKLDIDMINKIWIRNSGLGYKQKKYNKYNGSKQNIFGKYFQK